MKKKITEFRWIWYPEWALGLHMCSTAGWGYASLHVNIFGIGFDLSWDDVTEGCGD